jgi:hypothetical protein
MKTKICSYSLNRVFDVIVNCIVILACVGLLYKLFIEPELKKPQRIKPGDKIALQDVNFGASSHSLVAFLSTTCPHCEASIPFYKRIMEKSHIPVIGAFPSPNGLEYAVKNGLMFAQTVKANFRELKIHGTPTLVLVDSSGITIKVWSGRLPTDKETEVLAAVW